MYKTVKDWKSFLLYCTSNSLLYLSTSVSLEWNIRIELRSYRRIWSPVTTGQWDVFVASSLGQWETVLFLPMGGTNRLWHHSLSLRSLPTLLVRALPKWTLASEHLIITGNLLFTGRTGVSSHSDTISRGFGTQTTCKISVSRIYILSISESFFSGES